MIGVTGATGFIGGALCAALGDRGIPLDREVFTASDRLAATLDREGVTVLVHLASPLPGQAAALGGEDALEAEVVRLAGVVAEAVRHQPRCDVIHLSSIRVHAGDPDVGAVVFGAATPVAPTDGYGRGKARAEEIISAVSDVDHRVLHLRLASVQGIDSNGEVRGLTGVFARQVQQGGPLRVMGDGCSVKDLIHVDDVVGAVCAALDALGSGGDLVGRGNALALPIGRGEGVTVAALAKRFSSSAAGGDPVSGAVSDEGGGSAGLEIIHVAADPYDLSGHVDAGVANDLLGWRAGIGLEAMISVAMGVSR